jgi:hypothetical protein
MIIGMIKRIRQDVRVARQARSHALLIEVVRDDVESQRG